MTRASRNLAGVLVAGVIAALPSSALADGGSDRLDTLQETVRGVAQHAPELTSRYLADLQRDRQRQMGVRYIQGRTLFELGDYGAAAIVLSEVVEDPRFTDQPGWADARHLLAESLFRSGELTLAGAYFEADVADRRSRHRLAAARRLLEIAITRGRDDVLDRLLRQLDEVGAVADADERAELDFLRGQALYRLGRYRHAIAAFEAVSLTSVHGERAAYHASAVEALDGDLDRALSGFMRQYERLVEAERGTEQRSLRNLAALGTARIHYEREEWNAAITAYARVDRDSAQFDRALYELSWTLIREGEYRQAGRNLEVLALTAIDPRIAPEALLLKGETELRLERYPRAVSTFQAIRDEYQPIEDEVQSVMARVEQQAAQDLLDPTGESIRANLSARARQWMGREVHDLSLLEDIDSIEQDLGHQRELVSLLYAGLEAERQIDQFPSLREGWNLAIEHRMTLVAVEAELLDLEAAVLWDRLLDRERELLSTMQGDRSRLQREYARVPRAVGAMEARQSQRTQQVREAEIQMMRLEQEMQSGRIRIDLLESRLNDSATGDARGAEEVEQLRERIATERSALEDRQRELTRLEARVGELRQAAVRGSGIRRSEREVVSAYESSLVRERLFLEQFRQRIRVSERSADAGRSDVGGLAAIESERQLVAREAADLLQAAQELETLLAALEREGELSADRADRVRRELATVTEDLRRVGGELEGEVAVLLQREREEMMRQSRLSESEIARLMEATTDEMVVARRGTLDSETVASRRSRLDRIDQLRAESASARNDVTAFFMRAQEVVEEEGERWRQEIARAEEELHQLEQRYETAERQTRIAAANQALGALRNVHGRFEDVNLRANLGLLDVSWRLNDEAAARRDLLLRERNQALRILGSDFAEILED